jgi:hypothetical protein
MRHVGVGSGAPNYGAYINLDVNGNVTLPNATAAAQTAFQQLPDDVKAQLLTAQGASKDLAPALALASAVSSGQPINPQMAVAALATMATFVGGPVAGATIGAVAEIGVQLITVMQTFAQEIGLYPPDVKHFKYIGWIRQPEDIIPYGPASPLWINVRTQADLYNFIRYGDANHPPLGQAEGWDHNLSNILGLALTVTDPGGNVSTDWTRYQFQSMPLPPSVTPFEQYLAQLLLVNMQGWINGQPSVPPRDLLRAAAKVWNQQHAGSCGADIGCPSGGAQRTIGTDPVAYQTMFDDAICFQPAPADAATRAKAFPTDNTSIVSLLLGVSGIPSGTSQWGYDPGTTINELPPLCVNTGAAGAARRTVHLHLPDNMQLSQLPATAPTTSTGAKVAVAVAAAPAAVAAGTVLYAWAAGKSVDATFGALFRKLHGWVTTAIRDVRKL